MNNIASLDDLIQAIESLSDLHYSNALPNHSSIGEHVRHVIEYCDNFMNGISTGFINYDDRPRQNIWSQDQNAAIEKLRSLQESMSQYANDESRIKISEAINFGKKSPIVMSTIAREYSFIAAHIVHHLAIIKLMAEANGISLGDDIGKAASTVNFEKSNV